MATTFGPSVETNEQSQFKQNISIQALWAALPLPSLRARCGTQFDKTNDTLANVTDLSVSVVTGKTYAFRAVLFTTSNVAAGVKAAIAGTCTATAINYEGLTIDAAVIAAQSRTTTKGNAVGAVTAVTVAMIRIEGSIVVNAAGTLVVQFAQNVINAAASSVLVGSTFEVVQIA